MVSNLRLACCEVNAMSKRYQEVFDDSPRSVWVPLINEWVHSELDRKLLIRAYLDDITFEKIAEEFGISVNHCQKRVSNAKEQLFSHIKIK
jgi:hypothetical protein